LDGAAYSTLRHLFQHDSTGTGEEEGRVWIACNIPTPGIREDIVEKIIATDPERAWNDVHHYFHTAPMAYPAGKLKTTTVATSGSTQGPRLPVRGGAMAIKVLVGSAVFAIGVSGQEEEISLDVHLDPDIYTWQTFLLAAGDILQVFFAFPFEFHSSVWHHRIVQPNTPCFAAYTKASVLNEWTFYPHYSMQRTLIGLLPLTCSESCCDALAIIHRLIVKWILAYHRAKPLAGESPAKSEAPSSSPEADIEGCPELDGDLREFAAATCMVAFHRFLFPALVVSELWERHCEVANGALKKFMTWWVEGASLSKFDREGPGCMVDAIRDQLSIVVEYCVLSPEAELPDLDALQEDFSQLFPNYEVDLVKLFKKKARQLKQKSK